MRTKRQQKMLRGFTAGLSCCVILSAVLVYMTVSNTKESEVVVFSEILEGASARAEDHHSDEAPEFTHASEQLFETMFSEEMMTFVSSDENEITSSPPASSETTTTPPKTETTTPASTTTAPPTSTTTVKTTVTTTASTTPTTTPAATSVSTSKTPFTNIGGGDFSYDIDVYLTMLSLVNEARREAGVPELWYSARLHEVCELRTSELTAYYSHTRPDGRRFSSAYYDLGVSFKFCGENIAYGRNMFETPEEVFEAWMNSPTHKDNILHPDFECAAFGLSVLKVGNDTYYYWTQQFALF